MTSFEKIYCLFSVVFAGLLLAAFIIYPELRQISKLLPISALGLFINIGFMFIILRHIMINRALVQKTKFTWIVAILLFWPTSIVYLVVHGFSHNQPV